jgi:hypothetical protein
MTAAATRKERETTVVEEPPVSKALTDRIPADGEQVSHTLDPDRNPDTVRYPDPEASHLRGDGEALGAQSNAEIQMARRTDAGPREAATGVVSPGGSSLLLLAAGAVGLLLVLGALIALA